MGMGMGMGMDVAEVLRALSARTESSATRYRVTRHAKETAERPPRGCHCRRRGAHATHLCDRTTDAAYAVGS